MAMPRRNGTVAADFSSRCRSKMTGWSRLSILKIIPN
jgi:hypothetical protein